MLLTASQQSLSPCWSEAGQSPARLSHFTDSAPPTEPSSTRAPHERTRSVGKPRARAKRVRCPCRAEATSTDIQGSGRSLRTRPSPHGLPHKWEYRWALRDRGVRAPVPRGATPSFGQPASHHNPRGRESGRMLEKLSSSLRRADHELGVHRRHFRCAHCHFEINALEGRTFRAVWFVGRRPCGKEAQPG